jgi:hypothetical protein
MEVRGKEEAATSSAIELHYELCFLCITQQNNLTSKNNLPTCECFKWPATAIVIPVSGKSAESLGKTATAPDAPPSVFAFFVGGGPRFGGRMRAGRCFAFFCFWNHCIASRQIRETFPKKNFF